MEGEKNKITCFYIIFLFVQNISKRNTAYTRHQTSARIRSVKEQANWEDICPSMAQFIKYCRELPFAEDVSFILCKN